MVVIEMRDAAYETAFDLLEEAKHSAKKTKLTLCELEDAMYDCYAASKDEEEYEHDEDYEKSDEDFDVDFRRGRKGYRYDDRRHDTHEDDDVQYGLRSHRMRAMRRRRMG